MGVSENSYWFSTVVKWVVSTHCGNHLDPNVKVKVHVTIKENHDLHLTIVTP